MINPPEKMRSTASAKKNAPNPKNLWLGVWILEGRQGFLLYRWPYAIQLGKDGLRQLVVNGMLWSAGLEILEKGAANKLDPVDLKKHLENKVAPKKK